MGRPPKELQTMVPDTCVPERIMALAVYQAFSELRHERRLDTNRVFLYCHTSASGRSSVVES